MEHLDIFYRVFHEDLHPLTNHKSKEYYTTTIKQFIPNEALNHIEKDLTDVKFQFYKLLLANTQKKIKRELHEKVFLSVIKKEEIQTLVQNHQSLLINYCQIIENNYLSEEDELSKFQLSTDRTDIDIFKLVYQTLDNLLEYLEQLFSEYLNHTLPISYQQKLWFVYKNKKLAEIIIKNISLCEIPKEAKNIINAPLIQIRDNTMVALSYQQRSYLVMYIKVMKKLLKKESRPSIEMLYKVLISLEFNTFKIFFFLVSHFESRVADASSMQRLTKLYCCQKDILTVSITSPYKYNPNLPSLKEQLLIWIKEEINFVKNKEELSPILSGNVSQPIGRSQKKLIHISVPELSLITRLLVEVKIFKGSKRAIFQFLSETFTTKKAATISPESLSNRYYSVTDTTKKTVTGILQKMLYQLEHMEGDY